jgi:hypothetical protein
MTAEEILPLARQAATEREWSWCEPVRVTPVVCKGVNAYQIATNVGYRGVNIRFVLSAEDGAVLEAGFLPR